MASSTYGPEAVSEQLPIIRTEVAPSQTKTLAWLRRVFLAGVVVLAPVMLYVSFTGSISDLAADHRLAPTFGLVHGYRLYYPGDQGPVLSTLYGPVTALVYLPAALASTPAGAMFLAALITMALFYGGSWFALRQAAPRAKWWQMLGVMVTAAWAIPPLQRAASTIHADAPAAGFAAVAVAFAMRSKWRVSRWENEFFCGAFCVASILAKQNMVPLVVGLAAWIFLRSRWKGLAIFGASSLICSTAMLALIEVRLGGIKAFLFNCYYLPRHQPYEMALLFPAWSQLVIASFALLAIPLFLLMRDWEGSEASLRDFLLQRKTPLLALCGVLLVPTSIMGRLKYGAGESALCPALLFFALLLVPEILNTRSSERGSLTGRSVALVSALLFCVAAGVPVAYLALKARPSNPAQQVFAYCRENPGKVYFPQFPLAQLMAEGTLYHFSWGLNDRRAASVAVTDAHFANNIPDTSVMAILPWIPEWDKEVAKHHAEAVALTGAPQLPGFEFFAMRVQQVR